MRGCVGFAIKLLRDVRTEQDNRKQMMGNRFEDNDFIFTFTGRLQNEATVRARIKKVMEIAPAGGTPGDSALATIASVSPLSISLNSIVISEQLYINPCLVLEAQPGRIANIFASADSMPPEIVAFLKNFHEAAIVKQGDTVVIKQFGTSFCITEKVVLAS